MSASVDVLPHRPSLLDRRASSSYADLPDRLSVADLFAPAAQSTAARPAATRGASRKHSAAFLPFVPLTPIMASPLLTPDIAYAPSPTAVLAGHDPPQRQDKQDYLSHHVSPPHPTWTTSPPTPPPKSSPSPSPRAVSASGSGLSSPVRVGRGRSKSHSKTSRSRSTSTTRSGPRPASLASYTPTPLSRSYSPSPSLHIPRPTPPAKALAARRLSLPANLHKPLPPRPSPTGDGAPTDMSPVPDKKASAEIDDADAAEGALLPSLSRRAAHVGSAPVVDPGETSASRGRARKLFSLDDEEGEGDLSDTEDRERGASGGEKGGVQKEAAPGAQMAEGGEWLG